MACLLACGGVLMVFVVCQRVIADWIYEADYVIELLTYLSVTSSKQILFADNTWVSYIDSEWSGHRPSTVDDIN